MLLYLMKLSQDILDRHYKAAIRQASIDTIKEVFMNIINHKQFYNNEVYLTFSTLLEHYPNLAAKIRSLYNKEMSILIQQNYSKLEVTNEHIEIELSLVTGLTLLQIPFNALIEYCNETEKFALKFTPYTNNVEKSSDKTEVDTYSHSNVIQFKPKLNI